MLEGRAAVVAQRLDRQAREVDDAWQIPPEEAVCLHQIAVAARCRSFLEVGVSYGYSTLHLAHAARINGGHVHGVDASEKKIRAAGDNLREAGLIGHVTLYEGRAQEVVPTLEPREPFDFFFIDAVKSECEAYLEAAWPLLARSCVIVTDNTSTHWDELAEFIQLLRRHPEIVSSEAIPLGNGFEVSIRRS